MFPTDYDPPYTIIHTENTQHYANPLIHSPSIQSLSSLASAVEYTNGMWELVRLHEPTLPQPVHTSPYPQRSKSVAGLMRPSVTEMKPSRATQAEAVDGGVEGEAAAAEATGEPCQRPRSAMGFAQYTTQNMW